MEWTEVKKIAALHKLQCHCFGDSFYSCLTNYIVFYVLAFEVLAGNKLDPLLTHLTQAIEIELRKFEETKEQMHMQSQNKSLLFSNKADEAYLDVPLYLKVKVVEAVFKRYADTTKDTHPLDVLNFKLMMNDLGVPRSFTDFYPEISHLWAGGEYLDSNLKDYFTSVITRNCRFIDSKYVFSRYISIATASNLDTYLATLCSKENSCLFDVNYRNETKSGSLKLKYLNEMITKEEFSDVYVELLKNEADFWSVILKNDFGDPDMLTNYNIKKVRFVVKYYISNLKVIKTVADQALANGDEVRALSYYRSFLAVSDNYRTITGVAAGYGYSAVKAKVKKLEKSIAKMTPTANKTEP